MSGGVYEWLFYADDEQLIAYLEQIDKMATRLRQLGYPAEARYTDRVATQLRWALDDASQLRDVWRAVEWLDSGDWGAEQFASEMKTASKAWLQSSGTPLTP
jgi:hypothetical protein